MMFPLWTKVTLLRPWSTAYWMALRTSRLVPKGLIGLTPSPAPSKKPAPMSSRRNRASFSFSAVPASYSIPA